MTRRRTPRRRALLVLAPVAAVALAAAAGVPRLVGGDGAQPAFAAESIRAAEASPLLLVDGRGWRITRVDEFDAGQGG